MRQLRLQIDEPLPGKVLPGIAAQHGAEEAARRYRAIVLTTLRQLRGMKDTEICIIPNPPDAEEAIRFWLLPRLSDHWQSDGQGLFHNDGWRIHMGEGSEQPEIIASGHALCPWLSSRWVHTAMIGLERCRHRAIGCSPAGEIYFDAQSFRSSHQAEETTLPPLVIIHSEQDWQAALESPLGPALKKAWEAEI